MAEKNGRSSSRLSLTEPIRPNTRSSSQAPQTPDGPAGLKEIKEKHKMLNEIGKATNVLRKHELIPPDGILNLETLADGLLYLTAKTTKSSAIVTEALYAFSTYARKLSKTEITRGFQESAQTQRDEQTRWMEEVAQQFELKVEGNIGRLHAEVSKIHELGSDLAKEVHEVRTLKDDLTLAMREVRETRAEQTTDVRAESTTVAASGSRETSETPRAGTNGLPRFSTVVQVPADHASSMAQQIERTKQVLVDVEQPDDGSSVEMTAHHLVTKANLALDMMRDDKGLTPPAGARFVSVRRLKHGGLLYEVSTAGTARWLYNVENMNAFSACFGMRAQIKARYYTVVLANVPVSFEPSEASSRALEEENGWSSRDLLSTKWIKKPDRRRPGQATAYLLANFGSVACANTVILNGMSVRGCKIRAWRQAKEAQRCMRCQGYDPVHKAAECKKAGACAKCASKEHDSRECDAPDNTHRCVNCKVDGHSAWDRACPVFMEATRRLQKASALEQYRFFPVMDDPSTWERLPARDDARAPTSRTMPGPRPGHSDGDWYTTHSEPEEGQWTEVPTRRRGRTPERSLGRGANAVPVATDYSRPQTQHFRGPTGRRQATLTREGGFSMTRNTPMSRTGSLVRNDGSHPRLAHDE